MAGSCRRQSPSAQPLKAAAANWHALARFAARYVPGDCGLLVDIGSTTTDVIPLVAGRPAAAGPDRSRAIDERRIGLHRRRADARSVRWRPNCLGPAGLARPLQEVFATAWDVYLMLEDLPEEPASLHTADGRPATRACGARSARPADLCRSHAVQPRRRTGRRPGGRRAAASADRPRDPGGAAAFAAAAANRDSVGPRRIFGPPRGRIVGLAAEIVSLGAMLGRRDIASGHGLCPGHAGPRRFACLHRRAQLMHLRIVKLGGSLLDLPGLAERLRAWLAGQPPAATLLVVGGGGWPMRSARPSTVHGLDDAAAHRCVWT